MLITFRVAAGGFSWLKMEQDWPPHWAKAAGLVAACLAPDG